MSKKIIRIIILSCILLVTLNEFAVSQNRELDREILVYIMEDSLEIPKAKGSDLSVDNLIINSNKLAKGISSLGIERVSKAFPEWSKESFKNKNSDNYVERPRFDRVFIFHIPEGADQQEIIEKLEKFPGVTYAHKHSSFILETDTEYTSQWHLNNTGQSNGVAGSDIDAENAWSIFTGSSNIKIGIFDGGVDLDHVDLIGKVSGDDIAT